MRKLIIAILAASFVLATSFAAGASSLHTALFTVGQSKYTVDGQVQQMDAAPFLKQPEDRVFVPVRYLAYALGLTDSDITWVQSTKTAVLSMGNTTLVFTVGAKTYSLNAQTEQMDTSPLLENSRLFLPARYVAQAFGYQVGWDQSTQSVSVTPASSAQTSTYTVALAAQSSSIAAGQPVQLTVTVTGSDNQPAPGVTVDFTSTSSTVQLPATAVTGANGQVTVTAVDSTGETVIFTATVAGSAGTASVQWTGTASSASAGPYYLQLADSGNAPTTGQPVVFTVSVGNNAESPAQGAALTVSASSSSVVLSATSLVTNAQGQAFFTATDDTAETVAFTVTPVAGGSAQTASVQWSAPSISGATPYAAATSLAINSSGATAALGEPVVYTVTAECSVGAVSNLALTVLANSASVQLSSASITTNAAGQAFFTATDQTAESVTFTVRVAGNPGVMQASTTQWVGSWALPSSLFNNAPVYLLSISPSGSAAPGQPVLLTMTVLDNNNKPGSGIGISLTTSSAEAVLSQNFVRTNSQGVAYVTVTDSAAGSATVTATLANVTSRLPSVTTNVTWSAQPGVSTQASSGQVAVDGYFATMSESATNVAAGHPAVLTVTITNSANEPVSGLSVLVSSTSGSVQLTETGSVTNSQGQIFVTAVDSTAETVDFNVQVETNGNYGTAVQAGTVRWY